MQPRNHGASRSAEQDWELAFETLRPSTMLALIECISHHPPFEERKSIRVWPVANTETVYKRRCGKYRPTERQPRGRATRIRRGQFHFINWPPGVLSSWLALRVLHFYDRTRFSVDIESSSVHVSYWMDRTTVKSAIVPPQPTICQKSR
jgi:hypothetical protein